MGSGMLGALLLAFLFFCVVGAVGPPTLVVKGKVYCDACNAGRITKMSYFIEGANVAVRCTSKNGAQTAYKESMTDKRGQFSVHLSQHRNRDTCVVALLKSSSSACNVLTTKTAASVVFNDQADGVILTGPFSFKPKRVSGTCLADVVVGAAYEAQPEGYYLSPPTSSSSPVVKPPSPSPGYSSPSPVQKPPSSSPPSSSSSPVFKPPSTSPAPVDRPPSSPVYTPPSPAYTPPSSGSPIFKPPSSGSPIFKPPSSGSPGTPSSSSPGAPLSPSPAYKPPTSSSPVYKPPSYTPPSSPLPDDKPPSTPYSKPPASSSPVDKPPTSPSDKYPPSPPY